MTKIVLSHGIIEIENTIVKQVKDIANHSGVSLSDSNLLGSLTEDLIVNAAGKYNQKVVILYFMNDPDIADQNRATASWQNILTPKMT